MDKGRWQPPFWRVIAVSVLGAALVVLGFLLSLKPGTIEIGYAIEFVGSVMGMGGLVVVALEAWINRKRRK